MFQQLQCYKGKKLCGDFAETTVFERYAVKMKGTKVQTPGGRAVAGAWLVAWAIMAMGAIQY